jgi:hypothetical protein
VAREPARHGLPALAREALTLILPPEGGSYEIGSDVGRVFRPGYNRGGGGLNGGRHDTAPFVFTLRLKTWPPFVT